MKHEIKDEDGGETLSSSPEYSTASPGHLPLLNFKADVKAHLALTSASIKIPSDHFKKKKKKSRVPLSDRTVSLQSLLTFSHLSSPALLPSLLPLVVDGGADRWSRDIRIWEWGGRGAGIEGKSHMVRIIGSTVGGMFVLVL